MAPFLFALREFSLFERGERRHLSESKLYAGYQRQKRSAR